MQVCGNFDIAISLNEIPNKKLDKTRKATSFEISECELWYVICELIYIYSHIDLSRLII